jgi:hypothetical protein
MSVIPLDCNVRRCTSAPKIVKTHPCDLLRRADCAIRAAVLIIGMGMREILSRMQLICKLM